MEAASHKRKGNRGNVATLRDPRRMADPALRLGKGGAYVAAQLARLGKLLRDAVAEATGEPPTLGQDLLIKSALRHEQSAVLLQRKLRIAGCDLPAEELELLTRRIAAESDRRDAILEKLGIAGRLAGGSAGPFLPPIDDEPDEPIGPPADDAATESPVSVSS